MWPDNVPVLYCLHFIPPVTHPPTVLGHEGSHKLAASVLRHLHLVWQQGRQESCQKGCLGGRDSVSGSSGRCRVAEGGGECSAGGEAVVWLAHGLQMQHQRQTNVH